MTAIGLAFGGKRAHVGRLGHSIATGGRGRVERCRGEAATGGNNLYLGIDLGTSGVKAILLDGDDRIVGQSASLDVSTPRPLWSEQEPEIFARVAKVLLPKD